MSVKIIDTLKPKNNGSFPIVEAVDVSVSESLRLPEALEAKANATALDATNAALAEKADASDVATTTAELQGEIDQIVISASAEAVVAPEVAAARVDEAGASHDTLKARIDFEISDVKSDIGIINSEIYTDEDVSTSTISNAVIASNDEFTSAQGFGVARFEVEKGKIYKISRTNATTMRIAFSDSETPSFGETMHNIINAGSSYVLKNQTDYKYCFVNEYSNTAPSGNVSVVLASSDIASISSNVSEIDDKVSDISESITDEVLIRVAERTKISGCYMDSTTGQIKEYTNPVTSYIFYIPCKHNIRYKITKYSTRLFRVGTFQSTPDLGSTPNQYFNLGTETECYINTTDDDNYIAVHYYSAAVDESAPESRLYYSIAPYYTRTYEDYSSMSAIDISARRGLDEVKSLIESNTSEHINEFETQSVSEGKYIDTDGTLISDPDGHSVTTGYVDVKSGDTLFMNKRATIFVDDRVTDVWRYAFYDENKDAIIREYSSDLEKTIVVPEGASFFRVSAKVDTLPSIYNINGPESEYPYINIPCSEIDENETDIFVDEAIAYSTSNSVSNDSVAEYEAQYPDLDLDTDNFFAHGVLSKSGTSIVDENGDTVWLRGVGLHNLLVYSNLHSYESLLCLKYYGVNTIRLSAYPARITESGKYTNLGYIEAENAMKAHMCRIIDRCIQLGIYVIVDWHCMRGSKYVQKNNFILHEEEGLKFFDFFSKKYADNANVIYEFTNEPGRVDIAQLVEFIKKARTIVLQNCNYTPIMVTGIIDAESVGTAIETVYNELVDNEITDVFLSPHRYIGNPTSTYDSCISQGIPIFVTEWGLTGLIDPAAAEILAWHKENNVACINWKFTDQWEYSGQSSDIWAMLRNRTGLGNEYYGRGFRASDLTPCGELFLGAYQETIIEEV
jgi:endoglucanase